MDIFLSWQKWTKYRSYKRKNYWIDLYFCLLISLVLRKPKRKWKQYGCVSRGPCLFICFHLSQCRLLGALPEHLWRMSTACLKMVSGQGGRSPLLQAPGKGNRLVCAHTAPNTGHHRLSVFHSYCRTKANNNCLAEFPGNKDKLFSNCHGHWQFMLIKATPA